MSLAGVWRSPLWQGARILRHGRGSTPARRQVLVQVTGQELVEMTRRPLLVRDSMPAIGVGHHGEELVVNDELVDQRFGALIVDVVVTGAVDDEQIAFEMLGKCDR